MAIPRRNTRSPTELDGQIKESSGSDDHVSGNTGLCQFGYQVLYLFVLDLQQLVHLLYLQLQDLYGLLQFLDRLVLLQYQPLDLLVRGTLLTTPIPTSLSLIPPSPSRCCSDSPPPSSCSGAGLFCSEQP